VTDRTYFKEYWKINKDTVNKKRRDRYKNDAAYRSKAQNRAREHGRRRSSKAKPVDQTIIVDAAGTQYGTVGRVASAIKRSPFTVRAYCRREVIPAVTFYSAHGARLFSARQESLLVATFRAFDSLSEHYMRGYRQRST